MGGVVELVAGVGGVDGAGGVGGLTAGGVLSVAEGVSAGGWLGFKLGLLSKFEFCSEFKLGVAIFNSCFGARLSKLAGVALMLGGVGGLIGFGSGSVVDLVSFGWFRAFRLAVSVIDVSELISATGFGLMSAKIGGVSDFGVTDEAVLGGVGMGPEWSSLSAGSFRSGVVLELSI